MNHVQRVSDMLVDAQEIASDMGSFDENLSVAPSVELTKIDSPSPKKGIPTQVHSDTIAEATPKKKRTWKKPPDKPKRPLSAYNLFFQLERERIISGSEEDKFTAEDVANLTMLHKKKTKRRHRKTHGKISFADLARTIADKWKKLDDEAKMIFEERAIAEKERYKKELIEWNIRQKKIQEAKKVTPMAPSLVNSHSTPIRETGRFQSELYGNMMLPVKAKQENFSDMLYGSHTPSQGESLNGLLSQGSQYMRLVQQQKQMENELRQSAMDNMHSLMSYNTSSYLPTHSSYMMSSLGGAGGGGFMTDTADYYDMAGSTYSMAQMALPISRPRRPHPRFSGMASVGGMGRLYNSSVCNPGAFYDPIHGGTTMSALEAQQFMMTPGHSGHLHHHLVEDTPLQSGLMLDPHQGLSSPTFEQAREEETGLHPLMDPF